MAKTPLISIIVPAFNEERYIAQTLDSLCSQDAGNLEILVINDASTDHTAEIAREFNVTLVENENNMGVSMSRNHGIAHAKGEYIAFCDGDDKYMPGAIERVTRRIGQMNPDVVMNKVTGFSDCGRTWEEPVLDEEKINSLPKEDFWMELYAKRKTIDPAGQYVVKKDLIIKNRHTFENVYDEDWLWSTKLACIAQKPNLLHGPDKEYYAYRLRADSMSCERSFAKAMSILDTCREIGRLATKYPNHKKLIKCMVAHGKYWVTKRTEGFTARQLEILNQALDAL